MPPLEILSLTDKTVGFRFIENQDRFTFEIDREYAATKMHLILKILDSGKTNFLDVATVDREIISFAIDPDGSSVITFPWRTRTTSSNQTVSFQHSQPMNASKLRELATKFLDCTQAAYAGS